jgi:hypothetical protein
MSLRAAPIAREFVNGLTDCVKGSPHPSTPRLIGFLCPGNSPIDNWLASPGFPAPALSQRIRAHSLRAIAVWSVSVLGRPPHPSLTPRVRACCRLLFRVRTAGAGFLRGCRWLLDGLSPAPFCFAALSDCKHIYSTARKKSRWIYK